jgi:hypothetical protein
MLWDALDLFLRYLEDGFGDLRLVILHEILGQQLPTVSGER